MREHRTEAEEQLGGDERLADRAAARGRKRRAPAARSARPSAPATTQFAASSIATVRHSRKPTATASRGRGRGVSQERPHRRGEQLCGVERTIRSAPSAGPGVAVERARVVHRVGVHRGPGRRRGPRPASPGLPGSGRSVVMRLQSLAPATCRRQARAVLEGELDIERQQEVRRCARRAPRTGRPRCRPRPGRGPEGRSPAVDVDESRPPAGAPACSGAPPPRRPARRCRGTARSRADAGPCPRPPRRRWRKSSVRRVPERPALGVGPHRCGRRSPAHLALQHPPAPRAARP